MSKALKYAGQGVIYALIAVLFGVFSDWPRYTHSPPEKAQIMLSFSHGGQRKGDCRRLSAEEIAELAPNMRRPQICPRERLPLLVELVLDDQTLYRAELPPSGLSKDGPSQVHERFLVAPGPYRMTVRLRDTARSDGFDYEKSEDIVLRAMQNFVVDFRADTGGFLFL